jgi:phage anti-repressor protein
MQDIIPIFTSNFNNSQKQSINARNLHDFLDVKSKFATWIQRKVEEYGFIENIDFITLSQNRESGGKLIEYHISINMAKELSMLEKNDKGKQARLYFIKKEEQSSNQTAQIKEFTKKELLLMALEQEEKIETLQIENLKQKQDIEALYKVQNFSVEIIKEERQENQKLKTTIKDFFKGAVLFTRRQVCHFLARQGLDIKEQQITDFLNKKKWLCKGEYNLNKATVVACRVGWFVNDISTYETNGRKRTNEYGKFTVNGLIGIYDIFKKNNRT